MHSRFPGFLAGQIGNIGEHAPFYILLTDSRFLCVNFGLFRRLGAFFILPLPTAGLAAEIGLMPPVFQFLFLPKGLLFLRGQLHVPERRRDVLAHKIEIDLHRLGGFDTALAVTLMDKDFLDKLIEHVADKEIKDGPTADVPALIQEVRRVGSNLNQILKRANSIGLLDVPQLRKDMADLRTVEKLIVDAYTMPD